MRNFNLALVAAALAFSLGCARETPVTTTPSAPASASPSAFPDASATTEAKWTTFKAPDDAFMVDTPVPMSASKARGKEKRFSTPVVQGHVTYVVMYADITPKDASTSRLKIVKAVAGTLARGYKVEYEQQGMFLKQYPSEMLRLSNDKREQVSAQIFAGKKRVYAMLVFIPSTYSDYRQVPSHRFMLSMKPNDEAPPPETLDEQSAPPTSGSGAPQETLDEPAAMPHGHPAVTPSGASKETLDEPADAASGMPNPHK